MDMENVLKMAGLDKEMKRLLLLILSFGLIPSAQARVVYITNFGRINIEERCTDGKADHQIWYMDVRGKRKILNLNILTNLDEKQIGVPHKPSQLFKFNEDNYRKLSEEGFDNFGF